MVKRSKTKYLAVLLLVLFAVSLSGCSLVDRVLSLRDDVTVEQEGGVAPPIEEPQAFLEEPEYTGETATVSLFFADPAGNGLVMEQREIPKVEGIARATMNELITGPSVESALMPTIPAGTMLNDINVKSNGLCIVDLSGELVDNHLGGSTEETLTVYSIVNTLTQFPTVNEVQILVDGQYVDTIAGHVDVSQAMAQNNSIVVE